MKKTKSLLIFLFIASTILMLTVGINIILFITINIVLMLLYLLTYVISTTNKVVKSLDANLIEDIKSLLLRMNITNINTIQAYDINNKQIVYLNYYFSSEWKSGIQIIFNVVDNKLKFSKYGKFGWRDEKYNTSENQLTIDKFIYNIEQENIK